MEDNKRISWVSLFIKIVIVFIFALIIVWLLSKISGRNKLSETFTNNINNMEKVSVEYFKTIDLPQVNGRSEKITLGELIDKKLIVSVNEKEKNVCDTKNSYSKITRQKKNYIVETTLKCGKEKDTITKKFSFKDCRNCNNAEETKKKENKNTTPKGEDTNKKDTTTNSSTNTTSKTTYYEYVKETTLYSNWGKGNVTGPNVENRYEYYSIATDLYYTLGVVKASDINKEVMYTIKLDKVPNKDYYFSKVLEANYYNSGDKNNYINENKASSVTPVNKDSDLTAYSLTEGNYTYKLYPYYRKGYYYIDVKLNINNTNDISSKYDSKLNTDVYYVPIKMNIEFASNNITSTKPSGDYEKITYYRYVTKNKEVKWSTETSLEGYTKTGNTKTE